MLNIFLQTTSINIINLFLNIVTGIILARYLGPAQRGELAAIQTTVPTITGIALLGLPQAVVYWVSREVNKSKETVNTAISIFPLIVIISSVIGYFLLPFLLHAQSAEIIRIARIYLLVIIHNSFGGIYGWALQGLQKFNIWNVTRLTNGVIWLIIVLMGLITDHLSIPFLIYSLLIIPIPSIPFFWLITKKFLVGPSKPTFHRAKQLLQFGIPITISSLPQMLNFRLDAIILAAFVAPELLGYYTVGVTLSGISSVIFSAIATIIFPWIANGSNIDYRVTKIPTVMRFSMLVAAILCFPFLLVTPFLIPLVYGNAYYPAIPSALILMLAGMFLGINMVCRNIISGLGHPKELIKAEIVGFVSTSILLFVLLRPFQLVGAAITSLISYSLTFFYLCFFIKKHTKFSYAYLLIPTLNEWSILKDQLNKLIHLKFNSVVKD